MALLKLAALTFAVRAAAVTFFILALPLLNDDVLRVNLSRFWLYRVSFHRQLSPFFTVLVGAN